MKDYINQLLIQHIKVEQPDYTESQLQYLEIKSEYLKNIPQPEQRQPEWYEFRNNRLTASDLYYVTSDNKSKMIDITKKKCGYDPAFLPELQLLTVLNTSL